MYNNYIYILVSMEFVNHTKNFVEPPPTHLPPIWVPAGRFREERVDNK